MISTEEGSSDDQVEGDGEEAWMEGVQGCGWLRLAAVVTQESVDAWVARCPNHEGLVSCQLRLG